MKHTAFYTAVVKLLIADISTSKKNSLGIIDFTLNKEIRLENNVNNNTVFVLENTKVK